MKTKSLMGLLALLLLASFAHAAPEQGSCSGHVVDLAGNPIAGITVLATDVVDPAKVFSGLSDSEGAFQIGSIPVGSYVVAPDTVATSYIMKDDAPIVEIAAGKDRPLRIVLIRAAALVPEGEEPAPQLPPGTPGGGISAFELTSLILGALSVTGVVINVRQINDLQDENDRLQNQTRDLQQQIDELRNLILFPVSPTRP